MNNCNLNDNHPFLAIPSDVLCYIINKTGTFDKEALRLTCKKLHNLIHDKELFLNYSEYFNEFKNAYANTIKERNISYSVFTNSNILYITCATLVCLGLNAFSDHLLMSSRVINCCKQIGYNNFNDFLTVCFAKQCNFPIPKPKVFLPLIINNFDLGFCAQFFSAIIEKASHLKYQPMEDFEDRAPALLPQFEEQHKHPMLEKILGYVSAGNERIITLVPQFILLYWAYLESNTVLKETELITQGCCEKGAEAQSDQIPEVCYRIMRMAVPIIIILSLIIKLSCRKIRSYRK